jgi:hypothetical protein
METFVSVKYFSLLRKKRKLGRKIVFRHLTPGFGNSETGTWPGRPFPAASAHRPCGGTTYRQDWSRQVARYLQGSLKDR